MNGQELFDQIVRATRLTPLVAPFTVKRLLMRVGVFDVRTLTPAALEKAMPHFQTGLAAYLPSPELERAIADLRAIAQLHPTR